MSNSKNTPAFTFLAWASFIISTIGTGVGIAFMEGSLYAKGFFMMSYLFSISSCFTVAKVVRDRQEEDNLVNKIEKAKTEQLISKYIDPSKD